jgi:hypothetical protein
VKGELVFLDGVFCAVVDKEGSCKVFDLVGEAFACEGGGLRD